MTSPPLQLKTCGPVLFIPPKISSKEKVEPRSRSAPPSRAREIPSVEPKPNVSHAENAQQIGNPNQVEPVVPKSRQPPTKRTKVDSTPEPQQKSPQIMRAQTSVVRKVNSLGTLCFGTNPIPKPRNSPPLAKQQEQSHKTAPPTELKQPNQKQSVLPAQHSQPTILRVEKSHPQRVEEYKQVQTLPQSLPKAKVHSLTS